MMTELMKLYGAKALTDWKVEPTLAELKADLDECRSSHSTQVAKLNTYDDNYHGKGTAAVKSPAGRSTVVNKLIRKQAEWRYASLSEPFLSNTSIFDVAPVSWEDKSAAEQNATVLNNQFETKLDKVAFIDNYIRTAVDEGTVILKTCWVYESRPEKKVVYDYIPSVDPSYQEELQGLIQMKEENPSEFMNLAEEVQMSVEMTIQSQQPMRMQAVNPREEMVDKIIKNHPMVEVCDSRNVYIDPTCMGNLNNAGFVIYAFETSLSELRRSGKYINLDDAMSNSSVLNEPDFAIGSNSSAFKFQDNPRKKIVAYEYWGYRDIEGNGITEAFVATWVGNTLIRMEKNPYPDQKLPFVLVQYLPVRKAVYGEPDGALLEDNQKIQGALIRGMIDLMGRSANSQTGISKTLLDATNRRKFESGQNYEFNPNSDPRAHIHTHLYPEIPNSAGFMLQMLNNEAESQTGVKGFSSTGLTGQALGNSSSTSLSIRSVLDAASKREMSILRRLGNGLIQVGRKFIAMNAVFLEEKEVVRITNEKFITIKRDDLMGNFDLRLGISTAEADEAKAQELAFMLQTVGNSVDQSMVQLLLADVFKLRKMPDLSHAIKNFKPQPNPQQEATAAAELDHLKAQTELIRAQAQEALAKVNLQSAKVSTEQSRSENLLATANKHKLAMGETADGVTHAREMDKLHANNMANLESNAVKQQAMLDKVDLDHKSKLMQQLAMQESSNGYTE
jgi:hypothetical protein